jgi:hypothetical protein
MTVREGYYVNNQSIIATVRNQPFTPYNYTNLYYNFRYKGHFANAWNYFPIDPQTGLSTNRYFAIFYWFADFPNFTTSSTEYTVLPISLSFLFGQSLPPAGGQIDFQVQAQVGSIGSMGDGFYYLVGESSDWSNTQKVVIANSIPEFSSLFIPLLLLASTGLIVIKKSYCSKP